MPMVLSQKIHAMEYDDVIGEQYHYPRRYAPYVTPSEVFVYYHPAERQDRSRYYFGAGRIASVRRDPARPDHLYAEIVDYLEFNRLVPFKRGGKYLEARRDVAIPFFRAVRPLGEEVFSVILHRARLNPRDIEEISNRVDVDDLDRFLANLNARYKDLQPRTREELVARIDRPTSISRALKEKLGYTCQICGTKGFRRRSGGLYAEAHHLLSLHKLIPGSLISENILIVCPNCHARLHHADVEVRVVTHSIIEITINGTSYSVRRNTVRPQEGQAEPVVTESLEGTSDA